MYPNPAVMVSQNQPLPHYSISPNANQKVPYPNTNFPNMPNVQNVRDPGFGL